MITLNGLTGITTPGETVSGTGVWSVGGTQLYKDASGNLGLGVTPSAWFSGSKAIEIGNTGNAIYSPGINEVDLNQNTYLNSSGNYVYARSAAATQYTLFNGQHRWFTAPSGTAGNAISFTQAMTLDASGNLLVGTTSVAGGANNKIAIRNTGQSDYGLTISNSNTQTSDAIGFFNISGTRVGVIQFTTTATTYVTSSDQRLKTNIAPAGSAIQSILDFPVDQFDWIESGEHQDFGAVAQKAINVIPEMVQKPENPEEMWGIDWSKAVPRLIKTVQELSAELNELKGKIA